MKPKSKLQYDVICKSRELHHVDKLILPWAVKYCLRHIGYATKKRVVCMDCGGRFSSEIVKNEKAVCPNCNTKLEIEQSRCTTFKQRIYVGYAQIIGIYQVVRYFEISSYHNQNKNAYNYCYEILQHWIREDGKIETVARIHTLNYYCDSWSTGDMEIRKDYGSYYLPGNKYDVYTENFHPKSEFKPEYEKIGIDSKLAGLTFIEAKRIIPKNSQAETLLKARQYKLLSCFTQTETSRKIDRYWASIKICLRNNYIVKDVSIWFDYLDLLQYFGKDLHNAHYVCPKNLKLAHDLLMEKKRKIQLKKELEKQREKIEKDQIEYAKQKKNFFGMLFTDGKLVIKTLESVEEVMNEGDALHHCVYTNEYYKKPNCLIMSVRIDNKPIETIEISLKTLDIVQSRGLQNRSSEHHDNIISLVKKNMDAIRQKVAKNNQNVAV